MKHIDVSSPGGYFDVVAGTPRSQAATLVLEPGSATGGPENRHPESDQWLYVVEGSGSATVAGRDVEIAAGDLLLIEAGEAHEIRAGQDGPLVTINVYGPPAYLGRPPRRPGEEGSPVTTSQRDSPSTADPG